MQTFGLWVPGSSMATPISVIDTKNGGPFEIIIGSPDASRKIEADSNPGVDNIVITPIDSNPGSGHEVTEIKLATTLLGLDSAVAGDPLSLGTVINGGTEVSIFMRLTDGTSGLASVEQLIETNDLYESDI